MLKISRGSVAVIGGLFLGMYVAVVSAQQTATTVNVRNFAGMWKAPEYKVAANTDLDLQVWGKGASKVRNVTLAMEPGGAGILRIHNSVVDARGRVKPYSASVIEARLQIEAPTVSSDSVRIEPVVKVLSAEERYLDGSKERRTLEGITVTMSMPSADSNRLNIRYDTPQGTGSFGETLEPQGRRAVKSAAASQDTHPRKSA